MLIGHGRKNSKRKVVCAGEKDLDDQKHQKIWLGVFVKKSCKAQRNHYEEVWKPIFHQYQLYFIKNIYIWKDSTFISQQETYLITVEPQSSNNFLVEEFNV